MRKIFRKLLIVVLALLAAGVPLRADDNVELNGLVLQNVKLPVYRKKDLLLQALLFCTRAEEQGRFLAGEEMVVDLVKQGVDADRIGDAWRIPLYDRVKATAPEVRAFWAARPTSDGLLQTPKATLDKEINVVSGSAPVHFRSLDQDLDGVGFELDFNKQTLFVNSEVRIRVRGGVRAPEMHAESDVMRTDLKARHSELQGHVKVTREGTVTTCEKLFMKFDGKEDGDVFANRQMSINRILCTGEVVVELGTAGSRQVVTGERAEYLIKNNKIVKATITGMPKMRVYQNGVLKQESSGYDKIVMNLEGYDPASGKLPVTETVGGTVEDVF